MFVPHSQIHLGGKERYITQGTKHLELTLKICIFPTKVNFSLLSIAIHCIVHVHSIKPIPIAVIIVYG